MKTEAHSRSITKRRGVIHHHIMSSSSSLSSSAARKAARKAALAKFKSNRDNGVHVLDDEAGLFREEEDIYEEVNEEEYKNLVESRRQREDFVVDDGTSRLFVLCSSSSSRGCPGLSAGIVRCTAFLLRLLLLFCHRHCMYRLLTDGAYHPVTTYLVNTAAVYQPPIAPRTSHSLPCLFLPLRALCVFEPPSHSCSES